jgi:hypothetical protein
MKEEKLMFDDSEEIKKIKQILKELFKIYGKNSIVK